VGTARTLSAHQRRRQSMVGVCDPVGWCEGRIVHDDDATRAAQADPVVVVSAGTRLTVGSSARAVAGCADWKRTVGIHRTCRPASSRPGGFQHDVVRGILTNVSESSDPNGRMSSCSKDWPGIAGLVLQEHPRRGTLSM
jgi:hypothetical protein